jgi:hypothetical protein
MNSPLTDLSLSHPGIAVWNYLKQTSNLKMDLQCIAQQ